MNEIKRAMLGDKEAQLSVTKRCELLPCPFCFSEKVYFSTDPDRPTGWRKRFYYRIKCKNCGLSTKSFSTKKKVLILWNTRPQILTDEEMERLEEME